MDCVHRRDRVDRTQGNTSAYRTDHASPPLQMVSFRAQGQLCPRCGRLHRTHDDVSWLEFLVLYFAYCCSWCLSAHDVLRCVLWRTRKRYCRGLQRQDGIQNWGKHLIDLKVFWIFKTTLNLKNKVLYRVRHTSAIAWDKHMRHLYKSDLGFKQWRSFNWEHIFVAVWSHVILVSLIFVSKFI